MPLKADLLPQTLLQFQNSDTPFVLDQMALSLLQQPAAQLLRALQAFAQGLPAKTSTGRVTAMRSRANRDPSEREGESVEVCHRSDAPTTAKSSFQNEAAVARCTRMCRSGLLCKLSVPKLHLVVEA